jgi:predicted RNA-binding Zn ribbon-like protein
MNARTAPPGPASAPVLTPTSSPAPEFVFVGGRVCLDLVDTVAKRGRLGIERLPDPGRLGDWLREVDLLEDPPTATDKELDRVWLLREAVYRLVRAQLDHCPADQADLDVVNREAAAPDLAPQLRASSASERTGLTASYRAPDLVDAVLSTLARDAIALLSGPLAERVKECEGEDCTLIFLDDSQARRRRWCSMERCGNLAKIAKYRARGTDVAAVTSVE